MRKHLSILFTSLLGATLLGSCSSYSELMRSNNTDKKYTEALRYYQEKKYTKAIALFGSVMEPLYNTPRADTVLFYAAKSYYNSGDYRTAGDFFDTYRKHYSRSAFGEEAEYLYAMSYYNLSAMPERDQTETHKAIIAFNEYLNRHPESVKKADIQAMIEELHLVLYEKSFINAALYYKLRNYPASVTALRSALKENPENPHREEMMYLICKSWYNYAKRSVPESKIDRYMKMVDSYYNFVSEYPASESYVQELEKMYKSSQAYIDANKQTTLDIEKTRIDVSTLQESIRAQKEKLKETSDAAERAAIKQQIKANQQTLKKEEQSIKTSTKELRISDPKEKKREEKID